MDLGAAGLKHQPFPTHGKPLAVISFDAERAALDMLNDTYTNPTGLSLLQGPTLSGKSTLVRNFINTLHEDCEVAVVDGKGVNTTNLLLSVLHQFGYNLETNSANELLGLVRVFALQQAGSHEPPLLIIENAHDMNPSALRSLCELADLRVQTGSALKIVMVSDRSLASIIAAPAMESLSRRLLHDFHMRPMTQAEAGQNIHSKLRAAGSDYPDFVFPEAACTELWKASGGWPGILDRLALLALARAQTLPVSIADIEHPVLPTGTWDDAELALAENETTAMSEAPMLIVSNSSRNITELRMENTRTLIGRSEHNDISIGSRFVSRHHALLVRHGNTTILMDLNSSNGTFVNARRVSNHVLLHQDVISIGHHRIKFEDPNARTGGDLSGEEFADTAIMRTLVDIRTLLAKENADILPAASKELPNIQP